jgi:exosortase A
MPPDAALTAELPRLARVPANWRAPLARLALAWLALFGATFAEWREMAHQWWDIDTYAHILMIPPILAWLVWLRRDELVRIAPRGWAPGLAWTLAGLALCLAGRAAGVNLVTQTGAVAALQGAAIALLGLRVSLVLAFPLAFAFALVPFGDEIVAPLQQLTARMTVALVHASGVPATIDGIHIDTPAGLFVVAEACSGVKFLVAMVALGVLAAWTGMRSWTRRAALVAGCAVVSILANGLRAWGTIYVAQYVGAERAGGFDHIVYGWVFFAVIIAAVLWVARPWFDRHPEDAGYRAAELDALPAIRLERLAVRPDLALGAILAAVIGFAVLARLG